jgi:NAD(P)-dependent dehydrogenase (short-subunit alcohol dehydrogenase family)
MGATFVRQSLASKPELDAPRRRWKLPGAMALLDGKVCVVTGAGHGIGRATALLFAREGASVVVNDLGGPRDGAGSDATVAERVAEEIRAQGGRAAASHDSVASAAGASAIVRTALDAFGRLDALVNNAGILRDKTLLKLDEAMWDAVIDVHLKGTFFCTQAAARQFREQGSPGRIVNTTSVSGLLGNFGQSNYAAAKAGIYGLTRTASIELQRHQIMVNAVAPIAKTRMTEDLPMFEKLETLTPEHVAPAHLFLSSDLSGDLTGAVLSVAGAKMSIYKVVESPGKFKESDGGVWTAEEIAEHWEAISKL